jgi:hypothetical protein
VDPRDCAEFLARGEEIWSFSLWPLYAIYREEGDGSFSQLLMVTYAFLATDPRAKIDALLGLVEEKLQSYYCSGLQEIGVGGLPGIRPACFLVTTANLDILCPAGAGQTPSWDPDFSRAPEGNWNPLRQFIACEKYSASGDITAILHFEPTDAGTLVAHCILIDTVDQCFGPVNCEKDQHRSVPFLRMLRHSASVVLARRHTAIDALGGGDKSDEAFWRTMVVDSHAESKPRPAQEQYGEMMRVLLQIDDPPEECPPSRDEVMASYCRYQECWLSP